MGGFADGLAVARPNVWGGGLPGIAENSETTFALPAGTVTFLLTDIEQSTRQWEAHPEEMAQAVPAHYALLSDAVGRHGGVRPVEQGEGDSIVAAFSRASDALAAALDAQRALAAQAWPGELDLRVRIALHTAEAQLRDEGNYFGAPPRGRAARPRLAQAARPRAARARLPAQPSRPAPERRAAALARRAAEQPARAADELRRAHRRAARHRRGARADAPADADRRRRLRQDALGRAGGGRRARALPRRGLVGRARAARRSRRRRADARRGARRQAAARS